MSTKQHPRPTVPTHLVVMGVSGCGKSTIGMLLADRTGALFIDADDLHPEANVAKMRAGAPLDDDDRAPWLAAIGAWIDTRLQAREPGVVVCSALRRAYRDVLVRGRPAVRIAYLAGDRALIEERLPEAEAAGGAIFDGFPRTVAQAEALDAMLAKLGKKIDHVVRLKVDDTALLQRVSKRYAEQGRPDDNPESFKVRLEAYNRNTAPLLPYYDDKGLLTEIDGMGAIATVAGEIDKALA